MTDSSNPYEIMYNTNYVFVTNPTDLKSIQINKFDEIFDYASIHIFQPFCGKDVDLTDEKDKLFLDFLVKSLVITITLRISSTPFCVKLSNK